MSEEIISEARGLAAQCWCDKETSGIEMDARLAEAFAKRLAEKMETIHHLEVNINLLEKHIDMIEKKLLESNTHLTGLIDSVKAASARVND